MIHTKITPEYKDCQFVNEFVRRLPIFFGNEGTLLYGKRNTIKSFFVDGLQLPFQRLVVKKFRKPNLLQRFAC